jgi:sterol desaturase/sphingolipid hydroxylase (fatty acid hydroxylase superfamily)
LYVVLGYYHFLAVLAVLFAGIEQIAPRVPGQPLFRKGWVTDAVYLVVNSKYAAAVLSYLTALWVQRTDPIFAKQWLASWPWWVQFAALLVSIDFVKWCIHNLLHRIPFLWEFHKVHHSIVEMDWVGNWRFHWVEILVYKSILYAPTLCLGAPAEIALAVGVFDTLIGHFAHANVRWRVGWLKYVMNSPEMHIWHHNHPDCGPINRNFGLTLSVWDWLFGTAYVPREAPARLGFASVEQYPTGLLGQWWEPFRSLLGKSDFSTSEKRRPKARVAAR